MERDSGIVVFEEEVFAASFAGGYVFLDLRQDTYRGLGAEESERLSLLLGKKLQLEGNNGADAEIIRLLCDEGLVRLVQSGCVVPQVAYPKEPGGLSVCEWRPQSSAIMETGGKASLREAFYALLAIWKAERLLRKGMKSLVEALQNRSRNSNRPRREAHVEFASLLRAIEVARKWYPKRIDCLVGSGALALRAYSVGLDCALVIGVQKFPFYAHAWIEYAGQVMNDSSEVQRRLAPILVVAPGSRARATCRS